MSHIAITFMVMFCFVSTTTSRAVTVSTRGCTYRLPGSFRQFPLRGSNYADPADIQMLRLVLGSPAGGLGINGSDGRSVHASMSDTNCLSAEWAPTKVSRLITNVTWDAHPFCGSMHLLSSPLTTTVALAVTPLSVRYTCIGDTTRWWMRRISRAQRKDPTSHS